MHILDTSRFQRAMKEKGFRSISELAHHLGVHRNTIHYYLSGRPVFPANFERLLKVLDLKPEEILLEKGEGASLPLQEIAPLIDELQSDFPKVTFVLFGSRVRRRAHKYSDWDIGVFSKDGIPHALYRRIGQHMDDLVEDLPFMVDVVNLNLADNSFLREASKDWTFLAGQLKDWLELQRKVAA